MDYYEKVKRVFSEHGFDVEDPQLPSGEKVVNTTSLWVTHRPCGNRRKNGISMQKATKKRFQICPVCHDASERQTVWTGGELAAKIKREIGATLQGDPAKNYSRKLREGCETSAVIVCDECSHRRTAKVTTLLRGKDNGCPKCAGNLPHASVELKGRAAEYGLKVLNPDAYTGGSSLLDFECLVCGATFSRTWQNQRKRACAECARPFGEVLLEALCRYYFPNEIWRPQYPVQGLLDENPCTTLYYDIASPTLRIVIENHSEYHVEGSATHFYGRTPEELAERHGYDKAKETAVTKVGSPINGWQYGVVWFELIRLRSLENPEGSYLPGAAAQFVEVLQRCGHDLTGRKIPTIGDIQQYFSQLTALINRATTHGFTMPSSLWRGRAEYYDFKHDCGCTIHAIPFEIEAQWDVSKTGCGYCDRSGRLGEWRSFIELIAKEGWNVKTPHVLRQEREAVEFTCSKHPEYGVQTARRWNLREECRKDAQKRHLPTCPGCRGDVTAKSIEEYNRRKIEEILKPFDEQLRAVGMTLAEWEWKGSAKSDGTNVQYEIKCLQCKHNRAVYLNSTKAKLKKRKSKRTFCTVCQVIGRA